MSTRPITLPKLSATMESGHLVNWLKKPGDHVGEAVAEVESDKAIMELEAFNSGYLIGPLAETDQDYPVGTVLTQLSDQPGETAPKDASIPDAGTDADLHGAALPATEAAGPASAHPQEPEKAPHAEAGADAEPRETASPAEMPVRRVPAQHVRFRSSQYARHLAHDLRVDLAWVRPGDGETIRGQEVLAAARQDPAPNLDAGPPWHYKPLLPTHRAVADNMSATLATPTFSLSSRIPLQALKELAHERHHSLTLLLARALALSVRQHPQFNATYVPQGLAVRERVDVGIAVGVPGGLLTPVLRDAAGLALDELAQEWTRLEEKTLARTLTASDYQGATIYLSNLGMFAGVERFEAVAP